MSWIVQTLLSNSTRIKEKTNSFEKEYRNPSFPSEDLLLYSEQLETNGMGYEDPLINDEFNDLILIEKAIDELTKSNVFDDLDLKILEYVKDGDISFTGEHRLKKYRKNLVEKFEALCERIAFYMGDYFTNEGYIDYMVQKYSLTAEQEKTLRNYIQSRYKHTLMRRKPKNDFSIK
jgi:hypothetical protein